MSQSHNNTNDDQDSSSSLRQRRVPFIENLTSSFTRFTERLTGTTNNINNSNNNSSSSNKNKSHYNTSSSNNQQEPIEEILFECHICLDTASQPIVTFCGHLYCWPCIHRWMKSNAPGSDTCPTCKALLSKDKMIPIFVRGRESKDPRDNPDEEDIPARPAPQRTETNGGWGWPFNGDFFNNLPRFGQDIQINTGFGFGLLPGFGISFTIPPIPQRARANNTQFRRNRYQEAIFQGKN